MMEAGDYSGFRGQVVANEYYHIRGAGPGQVRRGVNVIDVGRAPKVTPDPDALAGPDVIAGRYSNEEFLNLCLRDSDIELTVTEISARSGLAGRSAYALLHKGADAGIYYKTDHYPAKWGICDE